MCDLFDQDPIVAVLGYLFALGPIIAVLLFIPPWDRTGLPKRLQSLFDYSKVRRPLFHCTASLLNMDFHY